MSMRVSYLDNRYYTMQQLTELLEAPRHQVEAAILGVSFPHVSMTIGKKRFWEKERVEPFFPAMRDFIGGNAFLRNKQALLSDIRAWVREQDVRIQGARPLRSEYLRWTTKGYTNRNVQYYGTWISLVLNAMKE